MCKGNPCHESPPRPRDSVFPVKSPYLFDPTAASRAFSLETFPHLEDPFPNPVPNPADPPEIPSRTLQLHILSSPGTLTSPIIEIHPVPMKPLQPPGLREIPSRTLQLHILSSPGTLTSPIIEIHPVPMKPLQPPGPRDPFPDPPAAHSQFSWDPYQPNH